MNGKELIKEFEQTKEMAELKALSAYSLEHELTEKQFKRFMELKKVIE
jgi:hypothetical protein